MKKINPTQLQFLEKSIELVETGKVDTNSQDDFRHEFLELFSKNMFSRFNLSIFNVFYNVLSIERNALSIERKEKYLPKAKMYFELLKKYDNAAAYALFYEKNNKNIIDNFLYPVIMIISTKNIANFLLLFQFTYIFINSFYTNSFSFSFYLSISFFILFLFIYIPKVNKLVS